MTPHDAHADYYAQMNLLMQALGQVVQRGRNYYNQVGAYDLMIDQIEYRIRELGEPPCKICDAPLQVLKIGRKFQARCLGHGQGTGLHHTKLQALKATRLWVKESEE